MANPFKTGRSRTITYSGSFSGETAGWNLQPAYPATPAAKGAGYTFIQGAFNCTVASSAAGGPGTVSVSDSDLGLSQTQTYHNVVVTVEQQWDIAVSGTWSIVVTAEEWCEFYTPADSATINGTSFPTMGGAAEGDGLPSTGVLFYEVIPTTGTKTTTCTVNGVTASVTGSPTSPIVIDASLGGPGYTLTAGDPFSSTPISCYVTAIRGPSLVGNFTFPTYSSGFSSTQSPDLTLTGASWTQLWNNGDTAAVVSLVSGISISVTNVGGTIPLPPPAPFAAEGSAVSLERDICPGPHYTYNARIMAFGQAFPSPIKVTVDAAAGLSGFQQTLTCNNTASTSFSQQAWDYTVQMNASQCQNYMAQIGPVSYDSLGPVQSWLTNPATTGDDPRDWRLQFRGFAWPAIQLSRTGDVTVDPCTATTNWTAGSHTTISISDGYLEAAVSGGTGSLTLAVPSGVRVWEAFRYLQLTVGATAPTYNAGTAYTPGQIVCQGSTNYQCIADTVGNAPPDGTYWEAAPNPLTISCALAGKTWDLLAANNAPAATTADLCCSSNETSTKNQYSSRFPVKTPGGSPNASDPQTQYEMGWGVDYCDTLTIGSIPDGWTLSLQGVSLVTSTATGKQQSVTLLEPFLSFLTGWTDGSGHTTIAQPFGLIETDGRVSDIAAALYLTAAPAYVYYSITQIADLWNYLPGVSAALQANPTDTYHSISQAGLTLGASGASYDWNASTWTDWVDLDLATGTVAVPGQDLIDEVRVYPGAGNVWPENGAYNVATPLQVSKDVRGQARGLVFNGASSDPVDQPFPSQTITTYVAASPSSSCGSGITNALGAYLTGTPWGKGNVSTTTSCPDGSAAPLTETFTWQNRLRERSSFRPNPKTAEPRGYDVSGSMRHCRTYVDGDTNTFWLGCADNLVPTTRTWNDLDSGSSATWARARYATVSGVTCIKVMYGDGTYGYLTTTLTEGQNYTSPSNLGSAEVGDFVIANDGTQWLFKVQDDSGTYNVYNQLLDAQGNVIRDWTITSVTGIDNTGIACRDSVGQFGGSGAPASWRIGVFYAVGGVPTVQFSSDGLAFA